MEAFDREDIDPKTIISNPEPNVQTVSLTKDEILIHMQTVITGCCNSFSVSNTFSSWKNTSRGLATIKQIEKDFHTGINLWVNMTMDCIIGCDNDAILRSMSDQFTWIKDLLLIKKYINTYYSNQTYPTT